MQFDQRNNQPRTDTTRHLGADEVSDREDSVVDYFKGARNRSSRFAASTAQLRELRTDIDRMSREAQGRPTGVLSGSDVDIAYHYLGMGIGIVALLYSLLGAIFAFHGGGAAFVASVQERWPAGPATALADIALHPQTIIAFVIQAVVFVVMVGTRRNRQSWQHWAALLVSAALTYAGWSTLLLAYGTPAVTSITATIPAVVIGGALGWIVARTSSDNKPQRPFMIAMIAVGLVAGALGVASLIHWIGILLAWTADQVARRLIVIG